MKKLWLAVFVAFFQTVQAAPFIFPDKWSTDTESIVRGGVYRELVTYDFQTLNAFVTAEADSLSSRLNPYGLLRFDPLTDEAIPYMAERYTVSPDKRTFTFTLRSGIKWSDGTPITADDFVTTAQIYTDEENISSLASLWYTESDVVKVVKINSITVQYQFADADARAVELLALAPQPAHIFKGVYQSGGIEAVNALYALDTNPKDVVSSGPFRLSRVRPSERVTFERNPFFAEWNTNSKREALPYLERHELVIAPTQIAALASFLAGNADEFTPVTADDIGQVRRLGSSVVVKVNQGSPIQNQFITFNWNYARDLWKQNLFRDVNFRRAMSYLVSRDAMIEFAYGGLGKPMYSSVPLSFPSWQSKTLAPQAFSLTNARALLERMGFRRAANGIYTRNGRQLEFTLLTEANNTPRNVMARVFADTAAQAGVKVNVRPLDRGSVVGLVTSKGEDRNFESVLLGISGASPSYPVSAGLSTCNGTLHLHNRSGRCLDPVETKIQALYLRGRSELDVAARKNIVRAIVEAQVQTLSQIYLVVPGLHTAYSARVRGELPTEAQGALNGTRLLELTWLK
jgi:peptide/nickel transport system substrate-binding protein